MSLFSRVSPRGETSAIGRILVSTRLPFFRGGCLWQPVGKVSQATGEREPSQQAMCEAHMGNTDMAGVAKNRGTLRLFGAVMMQSVGFAWKDGSGPARGADSCSKFRTESTSLPGVVGLARAPTRAGVRGVCAAIKGVSRLGTWGLGQDVAQDMSTAAARLRPQNFRAPFSSILTVICRASSLPQSSGPCVPRACSCGRLHAPLPRPCAPWSPRSERAA